MHPLISTVVIGGYATLRELREGPYDLEDLADLNEIALLKSTMERRAQQKAQRRANGGRR